MSAKENGVHGQAGSVRSPISPKPVEKSGKNLPATDPGSLGGRKRSPAGGRKAVRVPLQKRKRAENVQPKPEPQDKAKILIPTKRSLSYEARELLAEVDRGGIPLMITRSLERIANEHGITVSDDMTPNELVRRLRDFA